MSVTYHDPRVLPLGELVENSEQVNAGEHVTPAKGGGIPDLQGLRGQLWLLTDHTGREVEEGNADESRSSISMFHQYDKLEKTLMKPEQLTCFWTRCRPLCFG